MHPTLTNTIVLLILNLILAAIGPVGLYMFAGQDSEAFSPVYLGLIGLPLAHLLLVIYCTRQLAHQWRKSFRAAVKAIEQEPDPIH
jgi:biotin transporter BioY